MKKKKKRMKKKWRKEDKEKDEKGKEKEWMNEWIYYAIDNSLSASGQQDEQLKYHSQRFNAMSTIN